LPVILTTIGAVPDSTYTVITNAGEEYSATLLARDPINDVAILKIDGAGKKFPHLSLGDSLKCRLGMPVLTFGNALGLFQNTVSLGIISGLSRSITAKTDQKNFQEMRGLIQTDAAINPGNSGGPLTDARGKVIGINTAIIAGAQNICFAIPIHTAKKDLEDLKKYGSIRRPMLGIHYLLIQRDLQEKRGLPVGFGALVERQYAFEKAVHPKSPADKAGIRENDIITHWNGKKITFTESVLDYLENSEVGDKIELTLLREGKEMKATVILGERK
jgi:serine protease Do